MMKLSKAQWRALEDFAQAGGHGSGEYAYLSKPTARALERRGLVELGRRKMAYEPSIPWGRATLAGLQQLAMRRSRAARGTEAYKAEMLSMLRYRQPEEIEAFKADMRAMQARGEL